MNFGKAKIKVSVGQMGTEPEQDPDNYSKLRENLYELLSSPVTNSYSQTMKLHGYIGNIPRIT